MLFKNKQPSTGFHIKNVQKPFSKLIALIVDAAAKLLQSYPTLCDPNGLQPTRLLRPWDSPGKNPGVGSFITKTAVIVKFFVKRKVLLSVTLRKLLSLNSSTIYFYELK